MEEALEAVGQHEAKPHPREQGAASNGESGYFKWFNGVRIIAVAEQLPSCYFWRSLDDEDGDCGEAYGDGDERAGCERGMAW